MPQLRRIITTVGVLPLAVTSLALLALPATAGVTPAGRPGPASATPSKPDDITRLGDHLFVGYQNGVGPTGAPAPDGRLTSTIVEYTLGLTPVRTWTVTGKCDGLTADPNDHRVLGTVNEDGNSSMFSLRPDQPGVTTYSYSPALSHGGGTDSISVLGDQIYVAASAPSRPGAPALYRVELTGTTARPTPVLADDTTATDALTGARAPLALTDPDSTAVMPTASPRFAGDLMLDGQADQALVFLHAPAGPGRSVSVLHLPTVVNDVVVATSVSGTLTVTDNAANRVATFSGPFTVGTVLAAVPAGSPVDGGDVVSIDLTTGQVTPYLTGFTSPAGLHFSAR